VRRRGLKVRVLREFKCMEGVLEEWVYRIGGGCKVDVGGGWGVWSLEKGVWGGFFLGRGVGIRRCAGESEDSSGKEVLLEKSPPGRGTEIFQRVAKKVLLGGPEGRE